MEVAVLNTWGSWRSGSLFGSLLVALAFLAGGCNEVMVNTLATRNQGIRQYNEGDYADAAGTFRLTLHNNPSDYPSHYYLAQCLAKLGSYDQAIQQYKTTLELMNVDLVGKEDHVFRMQTIDRLAAAIVASRDLDPKNIVVKDSPPVENQLLIAKVNRGAGDVDAALEAYQQAAMLAPNDFDIAKEYSLYLLMAGQNDKARPELRRAYTLNPNDQEIASGLRRVGVVPGPSLKPAKDMVQPIVPVGPIPEVEVSVPAADHPARTGGSAAAE